MSSLNKVCLIGNLGEDPEIRNTQSGDPVANMSIATSDKWRDKHTGERRERTEWHRVIMFGPLADIADRYLRKGSKVYVEGQLQTRKWQDRDGNDRYTTEVVANGFGGKLVMLSSKDEDRVSRKSDHDDYERQQDEHEMGYDSQRPAQRGGGAGGDDYPRDGGRSDPNWSRDLDDEVPF